MARKSREKSRVRFARVPQGTETCPFCLMLASRGAVYYSKEIAGANSHYHPNCKCAIVPVWGNTQIEGYNPEEYYDRWKHPERYYGSGTHEEHESSATESDDLILIELQANRSAQVYQGITDEQVNVITAFIDGNDSSVASLYRKFEDKLRLDETNATPRMRVL